MPYIEFEDDYEDRPRRRRARIVNDDSADGGDSIMAILEYQAAKVLESETAATNTQSTAQLQASVNKSAAARKTASLVKMLAGGGGGFGSNPLALALVLGNGL